MANRTTLELTPRLRLLADWVPQGAMIADVGTDHAYLPVWLVLHERVGFAIASDLRRGPLRRAKETGQTWGVADRIDFRLCDGLSAVSKDEVDTIIIAGMGGETISAILDSAPWTRESQHTLLLQPMTRAEDLRVFLAERGYKITREALVRDRGTLYPVMEVHPGAMQLSLGQIYGGVQLLQDSLADRYLIERIIRLQMVVAGLNRSASATDQKKADQLRNILTALLSMWEEWRHDNDSIHRD